MRVEDDMVLEEQDINYVLAEFLRSYLFHHRNVMPERILIPKVSHFTVPKSAVVDTGAPVEVPVNFVDPVETREPEVAKTEDEIRSEASAPPSLEDLASSVSGGTDDLIRRERALGDIPAPETVGPSDPDAAEQDESK